MRAAFYMRVSTKEQTTDMQELELRRYGIAHGLDFLFYTDIKSSRKERPARDRLLEDVARGRIQVVVVWKLDRFGRSVRELLETIEYLRTFEVGFISLRDHIDMTTPAGRMMFTMLAAVAEFERDLIRERVSAGVRAKIEKTGRWGRRKGSEIYDTVLIAALINAGRSNSQIAIAAGCSKSFAQSERRRLRLQQAAEAPLALRSSAPTLP